MEIRVVARRSDKAVAGTHAELARERERERDRSRNRPRPGKPTLLEECQGEKDSRENWKIVFTRELQCAVPMAEENRGDRKLTELEERRSFFFALPKKLTSLFFFLYIYILLSRPLPESYRERHTPSC